MTSSNFNAEEFWSSFIHDIKHTRWRLLIQSPFATARRINTLANELCTLTRRGVTICTYVQEPRYWTTDLSKLEPEISLKQRELQMAIDMLESWGVHVNLRKSIHEKLAVIDEKVSWEGSLNILSHANTKEHMRRFANKREASAIIEKYALLDCSKCEANHVQYGITAKQPGRLVRLGELLASHRRSLNLSQRTFARMNGLAHGRVSKLEAGKNITAGTLFEITDDLGLELLFVPKLVAPSLTKWLTLTNAIEYSQSP